LGLAVDADTTGRMICVSEHAAAEHRATLGIDSSAILQRTPPSFRVLNHPTDVCLHSTSILGDAVADLL